MVSARDSADLARRRFQLRAAVFFRGAPAGDFGPGCAIRPHSMTEDLMVLYVDDEPLMRRALVRALRRQPVEVHTAASKNEALVLASTDRYDVLITDYNLTDSTGLEVAKRVREMQPG